MRVSELTSYLPGWSSGSDPIQMVGTPAPRVTRSSWMQLQHRSGAMALPGNTCLAPTSVDAYGRPHALAWNIGTIAMTVSRSETARLSTWHSPNECSVSARWLYATPFGLPVVPDV